MKIKYLLILLLLNTSLAMANNNLFRITLLGTGNPTPSIERFGNSTLIEAGSQRLLFDFGRGNTIRLKQLGVPLSSITAGFITHFHSDHISELPDFFLTSWLLPEDKRHKLFELYGPEGTQYFTNKLEIAYSNDENIRVQDEKLSPKIFGFNSYDVKPGVIYDKEGVKVIAFNNHHGDLIKPSYGYSIIYQGKKVVLSGDTTVYPDMVQNYTDADVIINEVAYISDELMKQMPALVAVKNHHMTPEEAGNIFTQVKPKLAVYSHIVFEYPNASTLSDFKINQILVDETRKTYRGPLLIGHDLTTIDLTHSKIPAIYFNN